MTMTQPNQNSNDNTGLFGKAIDKLMNFENSEVLKSTTEMMNKGHEVMDKLDAKYQVKPLTLDELLNNFSPIIDEKVIRHAKSTHETPVGGEIKFTAKSDNEILAVWEFYFTDSQNKYKKISSEKVIEKSSVTDETYQHIKANSPTFSIDPPKIVP